MWAVDGAGTPVTDCVRVLLVEDRVQACAGQLALLSGSVQQFPVPTHYVELLHIYIRNAACYWRMMHLSSL